MLCRNSKSERDACVMLIQQGARRNYIYARQLQEAGLLHSAVTDAAWSENARSPAKWLASTLARRLQGPIARRTVDIEAKRLHASVWPNIASTLLQWLHPEQRFAWIDEVQALRCRIRGLGGAKIVVNYHGNGGSFLDYARACGAKIVTDFVITPKNIEIEQAERDRWPDWESETTPAHVIEAYRRRMSKLVSLSDLYLCPSQTVARDLAEVPGFDPARVRLVPYGLSGVLLYPPEPVAGRVLFAGAAGLRKGLPYLAEAALILKQRRPKIEIVVAGHATSLVRSRPETQALTFLGKLGRDAMAREYARADVYCLPSLAEGSATSIFEAMANGLPTVTTSSSGSVVIDGVDGVIVPERDAAALAAAIERIVGDRELRNRMSEAAHATAERYNDKACGERFIAVIREAIAEQEAATSGQSVVMRA